MSRWAMETSKSCRAIPLVVALFIVFFAGLQIPAYAQSVSPIAAGGQHACAVLSDGTVQCWGYNGNGQLGNGTLVNSKIPVPVTGLGTTTPAATSVAAGLYHTCALLADHTVQCWGHGTYGQLGNGLIVQSKTPVPVTGLSTAIAVVGGQYHTCALLADQTVQCWGRNNFGQLGNGSSTASIATTPGPVTGVSMATALATGAYANHTCARVSIGSLQCWGANGSGQLGNETISAAATTPVAVSGLSTAIGMAVGYTHTCAVLADHTIQCWGANGYGQLGTGTTTASTKPGVAVSGVGTALTVAVGAYHTCAVLSTPVGAVQCWGYNLYGQLGNGLITNAAAPVVVSGLSAATAVATGASHSCALTGGMVQCWGSNGYGQLGNNSTANSPTPVQVIGITTASVESRSGQYAMVSPPEAILMAAAVRGRRRRVLS